jgi:hypothetical protein
MAFKRALKPLLGRYTNSVPLTLFRVQNGLGVKLRLEAEARAAGLHSYDITEQPDGLLWPVDPKEPLFLGPNGMSMRPAGNMFSVIVGTFRSPRTRLFEVPEGTLLPPELVLLHEHTDHYALQPAERMTLTALNAALTKFLAQKSVRKFKDTAAFYEAYPSMHPSVVGFSENA